MNAIELTQTWTKELEKNGKSAHTVAAYRRALEHFITWNRLGHSAQQPDGGHQRGGYEEARGKWLN